LGKRNGLFAVLTDGIDWAAFEGFHALIDIFLGFGLFKDVGVTAIILAGEGSRCGFAAEVAIDALGVHVEFTGDAFGTLIVFVSHGRKGESGRGTLSVKNPSLFGDHHH